MCQRAPVGTASDEPLNPFIQALLADLLRLRIHHQTRQLPLLALITAKSGNKLHAARPGARTTWSIGRGSMTGQNITTAMLSFNLLQRVLNRWVSDETGIGTIRHQAEVQPG